VCFGNLVSMSMIMGMVMVVMMVVLLMITNTSF
jgi:hypothetical protein